MLGQRYTRRWGVNTTIEQMREDITDLSYLNAYSIFHKYLSLNFFTIFLSLLLSLYVFASKQYSLDFRSITTQGQV